MWCKRESLRTRLGLRGTRDTVARQLHEQGIRASVKYVISPEKEAMLWDQGILGATTPRSLFYAVFFMNGNVLCLRGGCEHKAQLKLGSEERKRVC